MTPRHPETSMGTQVEPSYVPGLFTTSHGVPKVEPSNIPGLGFLHHEDSSTGRSQERVLTPTKLRHTPVSEPQLSPRRDNASQSMLDYQDMTRESTGIEYNGPLHEKKKKVRVKSAPKENNLEASSRSRSAPADNQPVEVTRKRKIKLSERPKWGTKQPEKKGPVKQSEKDPFFYQRQRQRELQRAQRQEKMHRMASDHAPKASESTTVASRARSQSSERKDNDPRARSKSPPAVLQARNLTPADPAPQVSHRHQSRVEVHSRQAPSRGYSPHNKPPSRNASPGNHLRSVSPPIPAIKHRRPSDHNYDPHKYNTYQHDMHSRTEQHSHRDKYVDRGAIEPPVINGQFVPFIRSSNILDPAHAESPLPMSREPSSMDRARKAYVQEHDPAKFGFVMDNFRDDIKKDVGPQQPVKHQRQSADPILNPALVTEHPSNRQSRILQQLSNLRRGLMQKQKELEIGLPGMEQALLAE